MSVEVQRVWGVYDERLQFMSRHDALHLDESIDAGDVSRAWLVWSGAAEAALADAYRFRGGPFLLGVWFLVGVALCFVCYGRSWCHDSLWYFSFPVGGTNCTVRSALLSIIILLE